MSRSAVENPLLAGAGGVGALVPAADGALVGEGVRVGAALLVYAGRGSVGLALLPSADAGVSCGGVVGGEGSVLVGMGPRGSVTAAVMVVLLLSACCIPLSAPASNARGILWGHSRIMPTFLLFAAYVS